MTGEAGQGTPPAGASGAPGAEPNQNTPPVDGTPPAGGTPPAEPFYNGFEDENLRAWVENKGFKNVEAVARSALHAEKMVNVPAEQLVRLPQLGDEEGFNALWEKLGRPQEASQYEFVRPEGVEPNEQFEGSMKELFHKAGVTAEQAKVLSGGYNDLLASDDTQASDDYHTSVDTQVEELKSDWGNGYDRTMAAAKGVVAELEVPGEVVDGIEAAVGYAETMRFFAGLAERFGEDKFVSGEGVVREDFTNATPQQAKVAWEQFQADPGNQAALMDREHPGHALAMQRKRQFFQAMYPGE